MREFKEFLNTIKILRSPKGCPWDRAQKVDNMKSYLLEEIYELIDGIEKSDEVTIKEELGDVLLIIIVIIEMFAEKKKFNLEDVSNGINQKLISRHPHVFSSRKLKDKEEVLKFWIKDKAKKKNRKSIRERLPSNAPSLLLASIFFKECSHLDKKDSRSGEICGLVSEIKEKFELVEEKEVAEKSNEILFTDIIFNMCKLAFNLDLDLENILRKTILKEANNITYP